MGRRLRKVTKRLTEVMRSTQQLFVMCKCRMKRVDKEEEVVSEVSLSHRRKKFQEGVNHGLCGDKPASDPLPQSHILTSGEFNWNCLGEGNSICPPSMEFETNTFTRLHFAEGPRWAGIPPGIVHVEKEFHNGAKGKVEVVSFGRDTFVRKTISRRSKGEYEALVTIDAQCEFVARLHSCFSQGDLIFLHMQYYEMNDLYYWMCKDIHRKVFTEEMSIWMSLHILTALLALHSMGVFHMDIKPANILISDHGYPILVDFGASIRTRDQLSVYRATDGYLCPELQPGESQQTERVRTGMADMWAACVILYEMITSLRPYIINSSRTWYAKRIPAHVYFMDVTSMSVLTREFLTSALEVDPTRRLGFERGVQDLLLHDLFLESDWGSLDARLTDTKSPLLDQLIALENTP